MWIARTVNISAKITGHTMPAYEAVVIGSGYGGGIAASRLARMGLRVALLEQGRLWRPGDFPTSGLAHLKTSRLTGRAKLGDPAGLYYLSVGKGLTVFGASGLGGCSLINAGVTLRPDLGRLRQMGWPEAVVGDGLLIQGLARAEAMLGVAPVLDPERFSKFAGMRRGVRASVGPFRALAVHDDFPSAPTERIRRDAIGVPAMRRLLVGMQCRRKKHSRRDLHLPMQSIMAPQCSAKVGCSRSPRRRGVGKSSCKICPRKTPNSRIEAPIVVLAAGTLGTNELLLRAQRDGLVSRARLGQTFLPTATISLLRAISANLSTPSQSASPSKLRFAFHRLALTAWPSLISETIKAPCGCTTVRC